MVLEPQTRPGLLIKGLKDQSFSFSLCFHLLLPTSHFPQFGIVDVRYARPLSLAGKEGIVFEELTAPPCSAHPLALQSPQ